MSVQAAMALADMCPGTKGLHHYEVSYPPAGNFGPVITICRYCGQKPPRERGTQRESAGTDAVSD